VTGSCEHLCSIKGGELFDWGSDTLLLMKDSAPWSESVNQLVFH
jgi:hypothetical protein